MTDNKELLDELKKIYPKITKLTYIELGILLNRLGIGPLDFISLGNAHDYLGGYKNEKRDKELTDEISKGDKLNIINITKIL